MAVVKELAKQRYPQVNIEVGSLIREDSGLAMSSRNTRLSKQGRMQALELYRSLREVAAAYSNGDDMECVLRRERDRWLTCLGLTLEYLSIVNGRTFEPYHSEMMGPWHAVIAAQVEGVRLIDNAEIEAMSLIDAENC